jgi:hypothetical protein
MFIDGKNISLYWHRLRDADIYESEEYSPQCNHWQAKKKNETE